MARKETSYTEVAMDDGRTTTFAGKRKLVKEVLIGETEDGAPLVQIRLDFVNGETRLFTVPDSLMLQFAAHGASQKLGDEIVTLENVEDCVTAIDTLMDRLGKGEWGAKRESTGMAGISVLAKALVELSGKTAVEVRAFLDGKTQAQKVALRQNKDIAPIIARLEAEKTNKAPKVDTDALLGELV